MSAQAFADASAKVGLAVPISWVERTVSTNAVLKDAVAHGVPHGTALVAGVQLGGRGRLGRTWASPEGNLHLSVVLRPQVPLSQVPLVCLATAVAVIDVCGSQQLRIKWPNDVLSLRDDKVAGILAEAELRGGVLDAVVVGVGVNVRATPPHVPGATCLADLMTSPPALPELAAELVAAMLRRTQQLQVAPVVLMQAWRALQCTVGRRVEVGELCGVAEGVGDDGSLHVRDDKGVLHRVLAGDVHMVSGLPNAAGEDHTVSSRAWDTASNP